MAVPAVASGSVKVAFWPALLQLVIQPVPDQPAPQFTTVGPTRVACSASRRTVPPAGGTTVVVVVATVVVVVGPATVVVVVGVVPQSATAAWSKCTSQLGRAVPLVPVRVSLSRRLPAARWAWPVAPATGEWA